MLKKWIKTFTFPPPTSDDENTDLVFILHSITLWGIPVLLLIVAIRILSGDRQIDDIHIFIGIVILTFLAARITLQFGHFRNASRLILGVAWVGVTYLAWSSDGLKNNALIPYMTLILSSALLLGEADTLILSAVSIMAIWGIAYADSIGLRATDKPQDSYDLALNLSINYFLSTVAIYYMIRILRRSFTRGQKELIERRQVETALRENEEKFRKVFHSNPVAICITTLEDGRLLEANYAYWDLMGMKPDDALGKTSDELKLWDTPEDRNKFIENLKVKGSYYNPDDSFEDEFRNLKQVISFYEIIHIGNEERIISMFYDMSEQRQTMEALRGSEARTNALLEAIPDMILEITLNGLINNMIPPKGMEENMPADQYIGRQLYEVFSETVASQALFAIERAIVGDQMNTFEFEEKMGGEIRTMEARVIASATDTALIMLRDVTQRKWIETEREKFINELEEKNKESETLRESLASVTGTFEFSEIIQRILSQIGKVVPYDSASVWRLDAEKQILIGQHGLPGKISENLEFTIDEQNHARRIFSGELPYIISHDVQKDFSRFQQEPHTYINSWLGVPLKVRDRVVGLIALDGSKKKQFNEHHAELAVNFANQVAIALENARLFSDLQAELSVRQNFISELESKNAELERFTYTVSHDLKSPLFTIRGFLGYLEEDALAGKHERVRSDVQRITDATNKMQQLLNELLELSRVGRMKNDSISIPFEELAREAVELVHGHIMERGVAVRIDDNMPIVFGDRQRLLEVVQNLVSNAAKFMGDQSDPRIEIGHDGEEDGMAVFYVRDNGIGIPKEHHDRVFGLFNKLDAKSDGTGIGLALVKRIVEVHGGRIWIQSASPSQEKAGQGSTFFFSLPCSVQ